MGSGEDNTPDKSSKQTAPAQEATPATPSYQDWSASMQAFYGSGATPPAFFTSPVASSPGHPYLWGPQHFIPAYGSPLPYPVMYPHTGYPHPDMAVVHGPAQTTTETEEKGPVRKDKKKSKKIAGSVDQIAGKSSENEKVVSGPGNDGTSQRSINSGETRSEGSSSTSNENTNQHESNRRSSDMVLANGTNAQNLPRTSLDVGMDLRNASSATVPLRIRTVTGLSSLLAPATTVGCQGTVPDHLLSQDERELRREKRKQSNRESARRSRLRKQAECEELQVKVDTLSNENHILHKELKRLAEECARLKDENATVEEQLRHFCGSNGMSTLEASHANIMVPYSANDEKDDDEQHLNGSTDFSAEKQNHHRRNDNHDSAPS